MCADTLEFKIVSDRASAVMIISHDLLVISILKNDCNKCLWFLIGSGQCWALFAWIECCLSMAQCKTMVSQVLMHWRYCSLSLNHQYGWNPCQYACTAFGMFSVVYVMLWIYSPFYILSWSLSHWEFCFQVTSIYTPSDFEGKSLGEIQSDFGWWLAISWVALTS